MQIDYHVLNGYICASKTYKLHAFNPATCFEHF
jgi:hypothetical protein